MQEAFDKLSPKMRTRIIKQKTSWAIRFDLLSGAGKRKQKQISGFRTSREVKKALTDIESKINNNAYISDNLTVGQIFNIWFNDYVYIDLAPKTQLYYQGLTIIL